MDVKQTRSLLGDLSPVQFMRRHWQKKPLVVHGAIPGFKPLLSRAALFSLAGQDDVESRLIRKSEQGWTMKSGPFSRRSFPPVNTPGWTLLVQGVDLHHAGAHALLGEFRFLPDARLDDMMISWASEGGGVGPHVDSYDVFLLQASGRRRWQIGRQQDVSLQAGVPLKILQHFEPEEEFVLDAGDMLYLPPGYAHDGVAVPAPEVHGEPADCMTYSIGFRAPGRDALAAQLLHRLADFGDDAADNATARPQRLYRDAAQGATDKPGKMPKALLGFARKSVDRALTDPLALACALGELMTEPKASVYFDGHDASDDAAVAAEVLADLCVTGLRLNLKTRMLYDDDHIFINGESYRAKGRDAALMHKLADNRSLAASRLQRASHAALALLRDWQVAGWLEPLPYPPDAKAHDAGL
jgi:50S ribosomal protein L16 3-hydroxylase